MEKYMILSNGRSPHTLKWIKELKKYFQLYLVSFDGVSDLVRNEILADNIFDLSYANVYKGKVRLLKRVDAVGVIIRQIRPAYLNAHYLTDYGMVTYLGGVWSFFSGKLILSAWGSDVLCTPWESKRYFRATYWLLKKADIVTSDSKYMTSKILEIYSEAKILTFPFGIDELPDIVNKDKNDLYFFSNRAIKENYNIDQVIHIFAKLQAQMLERKLIIANVGNKLSSVKLLVNRLGLNDSVNFVGFLTEKQQREYYKYCRYYFSLPSSDSTSVSLLEAMSYGCIPIVSNISANHEWVTAGVNGYFSDTILENNMVRLDENYVFQANRELIAQNAIFSNCIKNFINDISR